MLDFADSPATRYFSDTAITLDDGVSNSIDQPGGYERTLYVRFDFTHGNLRLTIEEGEHDKEISRSDTRNYPDAEAVIRAIDKEYPGRIELDSFLPKVRSFFESLYRSYTSSGTVAEVNGYCGSCGTSGHNEFAFLFVPAVPDSPHDKASLNLSWDYGCYGGEALGGEFDEVRKPVLEMLYRMRVSAGREAKREITKMIRVINDEAEHPKVYVLYPPANF